MRTGSRLRQAAAIALVVPAALLPRPAGARAAIDLTANSNLGFGQIVATPTAGSVIVSPAGIRTRSGGVLLGNAAGAGAASFTVSGDPNTAYTLTLPSSCVLSAGGSSMTVDTFESATPLGQYLLGPGGTASYTVGATLRVGAAQLPGAYSGTYDVTVAYE